MNFSLSSLIAGLLFGILGVFFFKEGKREGNVLRILIGLTLMIYPYFIENDYILWSLGVGLTFLAYRN